MFRCKNIMTLQKMNENMVYQNHISKRDQRNIEQLFARLFSSEDGKNVLAYLQNLTFHRAANPSQSEADLRHMEGQRSLLATMLRLIERGRG